MFLLKWPHIFEPFRFLFILTHPLFRRIFLFFFSFGSFFRVKLVEWECDFKSFFFFFAQNFYLKSVPANFEPIVKTLLSTSQNQIKLRTFNAFLFVYIIPLSSMEPIEMYDECKAHPFFSVESIVSIQLGIDAKNKVHFVYSFPGISNALYAF